METHYTESDQQSSYLYNLRVSKKDLSISQAWNAGLMLFKRQPLHSLLWKFPPWMLIVTVVYGVCVRFI